MRQSSSPNTRGSSSSSAELGERGAARPAGPFAMRRVRRSAALVLATTVACTAGTAPPIGTSSGAPSAPVASASQAPLSPSPAPTASPSSAPSLAPLPPGTVLDVLTAEEVAATTWMAVGKEVAFESADVVRIVDPVTRARTGTVPVPKVRQLSGVLVTRDSVWFLDHDGGRVIRVDRKTGKEVARIKIGFHTVSLLETEHGVWAGSADELPEHVVLIDPATNKVIRRIDQGTFPASGLGSLWFGQDELTFTDDVRRVDPLTGAVQATIDLESRAEACDVRGRFPEVVWGWCWDDFNGTVAARLDVERSVLMATVPFDGPGAYVAATAEHSWFAVDRPFRLVRIRNATNTIDRAYALPYGSFVEMVRDELWILDLEAGHVRSIPIDEL